MAGSASYHICRQLLRDPKKKNAYQRILSLYGRIFSPTFNGFADFLSHMLSLINYLQNLRREKGLLVRAHPQQI